MKEMAAVPVAQRIADGKAAAPVADLVLVPMLDHTEAARVPLLEVRVALVYVNARHVTSAVRASGDRGDQAGCENVGDLEADMILAVSERGHLDEAVVLIASDSKSLRE